MNACMPSTVIHSYRLWNRCPPVKMLGVGTPASLCPNVPPYMASDKWDEELARFAPDEANELLDSIGLDQKDSEARPA